MNFRVMLQQRRSRRSRDIRLLHGYVLICDNNISNKCNGFGDIWFDSLLKLLFHCQGLNV